MTCETFDFQCGLEIAKAIPGFFTAGAAIFGAWIAKKGLDKWKSETMGKRRIELAEQALTLAYETADVLALARTWVPRSESIKPETPPSKQELLERLDKPLELLRDHAELFAKLRLTSFAFAIHFGPNSTGSFSVLLGLRDELNFAAHAAIAEIRRGGGFDPMPILSTSAELDETDAKIARAVSDLEQICKSVLASNE